MNSFLKGFMFSNVSWLSYPDWQGARGGDTRRGTRLRFFGGRVPVETVVGWSDRAGFGPRRTSRIRERVDLKQTAKAWRIEDLIEPILSSLAFGDAVMVKGSKGVRLALLIEQIRKRFAVAS